MEDIVCGGEDIVRFRQDIVGFVQDTGCGVEDTVRFVAGIIGVGIDTLAFVPDILRCTDGTPRLIQDTFRFAAGIWLFMEDTSGFMADTVRFRRDLADDVNDVGNFVHEWLRFEGDIVVGAGGWFWLSRHQFPGACQGKNQQSGDAMANYDTPGLTYDSGVLYDAVSPPQPTKRMAKIKVKLNLATKSDADLLTFAQAHVAAVTGNANFTTPLPAAAAFTAVLTPYSTALGNFNAAQVAAKTATTVKDTARLALESALSQRGNYVELTAASAADPVAVVESAGFSVKASGSPTTPPEMVMNLAVTSGDNAGELDLTWDPASGAKTYDIETSPEPMTTTSWTAQPSVTKSKAVILGLTSGQKMWVRVRAVGPGGTGAWSDPATKIVP